MGSRINIYNLFKVNKMKTNYKDIDAKKKRMAVDFRRFLMFRGTGQQVEKYLGNDLAGIREWLEGNFQGGMSWKNYGEVWVVDHIVPLRMFNLFDEKDLQIVWHYKNLMPLLKVDNLKKEGNVFFAFEMLHELKDKDAFFAKLYERILPEVKWMIKYLNTYTQKYRPAEKAALRHIRNLTKKTA